MSQKLKIKRDQPASLYLKCVMVIDSCETVDHLEVAQRYINRAIKLLDDSDLRMLYDMVNRRVIVYGKGV